MLWRRANARNVSFRTVSLHDGQFTLKKLANYLGLPLTDAAPQFLYYIANKWWELTYSWIWGYHPNIKTNSFIFVAKFLKGRSTKYILVFKGGWDGIRSCTEETHIVQRGTCSCHRPTTLRENNLFYLKNWSFNSAPLFNHSVTSKINPSRLNSTIKSSYLVNDHIFYSRNLNAWFRGDIVRRNLMLVTLTGQRVNRRSIPSI